MDLFIVPTLLKQPHDFYSQPGNKLPRYLDRIQDSPLYSEPPAQAIPKPTLEEF